MPSPFVVVNARYRLLGAKTMGNGTGRDVGGLLGGNADEEVGLVGTRLLECADAGWQCAIGHDVILGNAFQTFLIVVDEHAVLMFTRQ